MTQTIVTVAEAQTDVPGFSALASQAQTDLVNAATSALNHATRRVLPLTTHDELYAPENTRTLRLRQYPVVDIARMATGLQSVLTIACTDPAASRAWTKLTFTGQQDTLAVTGLTLNETVGGATTPTPLLFATYTTVAALAAAINATPNWKATVLGSLTGNWGTYATADLNADLGAKGALNPSPVAAYWAFTRDLSLYDLEDGGRTGVVTLHEELYQPFRFPDRVYTASGQFGSVRTIYSAGYNNDTNVGAVTMPDALKRAAFVLIQAMTQRTTIGLKSAEQISYGRQDYEAAANSLLGLVTDLWYPFRRRRLT